MTKDEAIAFCFSQIRPTILEESEYNKFKLIRNRYQNGKAGAKAIKTLFDRFGIIENSYYTIKNEK